MITVLNKKDSAAITIYGDIVDDADGEWLGEPYVWPSKLKEQLDACDGKDLTVYINSDGGSIPAGVAMSNMLKRHKGHTKAVVDGWCCSIATQIFFSCEDREIPANAYLMIHKPSCMVAGNADDMLKAADTLDVLQKGLETTYGSAALKGVKPEDIHKMVEDETWLTGEDAAKYFKLTVAPAAQAVAQFGRAKSGFKNIPEKVKFKAAAEAAEKKKKQQKLRVAIACALAEGELEK